MQDFKHPSQWSSTVQSSLIAQSCPTLCNSLDCFSSSHVWMWELDYKESWVLKNWCFWTVVLKKTPEGPLDCKEIQPVHPKGNQSWIFIGRTDAKPETPIFWLPDVRTDSLEKTLMLGKIEGRRKRGHRGGDGWMASLTWWTLTKLLELVKVREAWHSAVHGVTQNELNSSKQHCVATSAKFCQLGKFSWAWLPWIYWGTVTIISSYSACVTDFS